MHILHIEDNVFKHRDICNVLQTCGKVEIAWAKNLEEGIEMIQRSVEDSRQYDIIITDMYYPLVQGGAEVEAGELLIQKIREMGLVIPVILCSSADIRMQGILGTVHYSEREDWESELRKLVKSQM